MARGFSSFRRRAAALAVIVALLPAIGLAANRAVKQQPNQPATPDETVELFQGIEQGKIAVKLIPKDSTECNVLVENKTDRPLTVQMPDAFAGVPVLAQLGGGAGGFGQGAGAQPLGGGGMMGGGGGMMGGGGMFNIPPEKVGKVKCPAVCLEHGKPDPRPAIPYEIKPIESFTDKAAVHELCRMLGTGRINQRAAQAAAWHLQDGMSWRELAAKRVRYADGSSRPYFAPKELQAAVQIAVTAVNLAEKRQETTPSPGESAAVR